MNQARYGSTTMSLLPKDFMVIADCGHTCMTSEIEVIGKERLCKTCVREFNEEMDRLAAIHLNTVQEGWVVS